MQNWKSFLLLLKQRMKSKSEKKNKSNVGLNQKLTFSDIPSKDLQIELEIYLKNILYSVLTYMINQSDKTITQDQVEQFIHRNALPQMNDYIDKLKNYFIDRDNPENQRLTNEQILCILNFLKSEEYKMFRNSEVFLRTQEHESFKVIASSILQVRMRDKT